MLWLGSGGATIIGNRIINNSAGDHGGGIVVASPKTTIMGNLIARNNALGLGVGDTGSGGGIWVAGPSAEIINNTLYANAGYGESVCSVGGILIEWDQVDARVYANVLAFNVGCGIGCENGSDAVVENNILWDNEGADLGSDKRTCRPEWIDKQLYVDPLFCDPDGDNYSVQAGSPALTGPVIIGAFPTPGCSSASP